MAARSSLKWRITFKTKDEMFSSVRITKKAGFELDENEVKEWAEITARDDEFYASVYSVEPI